MRLPFANAACLAPGQLVLVALVALVTPRCTWESDPPIYLDTEYQLRCNDCTPRTPDEPAREVMLLDGEQGWKFDCSVSELSGRPAMTLTAAYMGQERNEMTHGIRITRAHIEGDVSDACEVRVVEDANIYEGACTAGEPNDTTPCQVKFRKKDNVIQGSVYCYRIPNTANLSSFRYLVEPGTDGDAASLAVHNCPGL